MRKRRDDHLGRLRTERGGNQARQKRKDGHRSIQKLNLRCLCVVNSLATARNIGERSTRRRKDEDHDTVENDGFDSDTYIDFVRNMVLFPSLADFQESCGIPAVRVDSDARAKRGGSGKKEVGEGIVLDLGQFKIDVEGNA